MEKTWQTNKWESNAYFLKKSSENPSTKNKINILQILYAVQLIY